MPRASLSLNEARQLAVAAQGFTRPRPLGPVNAGHLARTITALGVLQLDYVNLIAPSHLLVLYARLGPYDRSRLEHTIYRRGLFTEQWGHEASVVPMATWPLLRHRRKNHRARPRGFDRYLEDNADYAHRLLRDIRRHGPLSIDALPDPMGAQRLQVPGWSWGTGIKRQVLEAFFGRGLLAVTRRLPNFSREYDLAERVIPAAQRRRRPGESACHRELLRQAAAAHGVGTAADLADYFRLPVSVARPRLQEMVQSGELLAVQVEGWNQVAYMDPTLSIPRRPKGTALLSPFDPLIWFRPRCARLFGFDYRFEIFIPAARRRWGAYVLPFLLDGRLVARVDVKADRISRRLEVPGAWLEADRDGVLTAERLAPELRQLADWLGLERIRIGRRGDLARILAAALRRRRSPAQPPAAARERKVQAAPGSAGMAATEDNTDITWWLYMIRCADQSLYTGITTDVNRRLKAHREGRGARYLRGRGPLRLALQERIGDRSAALKLEARVKKLPRSQKEALLKHGHLPHYLRSPDATAGA